MSGWPTFLVVGLVAVAGAATVVVVSGGDGDGEVDEPPPPPVDTTTAGVSGPTGPTGLPDSTTPTTPTPPPAPATEPCSLGGTPGDDREANDSQVSANGPLVGSGAQVSGAVDTDNDHDYYVFCTSAAAQIEVTLRVGPCGPDGCGEVNADLFGDGGGFLNTTGPVYDLGDTGTLSQSVNQPGRFFLDVTGDLGDRPDVRYDLRLSVRGGQLVKNLPLG